MNFLQKLIYKPHRTTLQITSANGFHLRPAAQFVSKAKGFDSEIKALFKEKEADAKAVNSLLSLGLEKEDRFTLQVRGKDAKEALESLETLFHTLMQDDKETETVEKRKRRTKVWPSTVRSLHREWLSPLPADTKRRRSKKESDLSFSEALANSLEELATLYRAHRRDDDAGIYLAQKELLHAVSSGIDSLEDLEQTIAEESARLVGGRMEAKISDYNDILQRVKKQMGIETEMILPDTPSILLAKDLLPSQIEQLKESNVEGVILKETTLTSHTAILLRGAGIPSPISDHSPVEENSEVILDAHSGLIVMHPSSADTQKARERHKEDQAQKALASRKRFEKALTRTQKEIRVFANVTGAASAKTAKEEGAEGIGLLRTEFLFKEAQPTLEEQTAAYKEIFGLFDEITVRTLDVGGDKKLPYLTLPHEENPFLGIRGSAFSKHIRS